MHVYMTTYLNDWVSSAKIMNDFNHIERWNFRLNSQNWIAKDWLSDEVTASIHFKNLRQISLKGHENHNHNLYSMHLSWTIDVSLPLDRSHPHADPAIVFLMKNCFSGRGGGGRSGSLTFLPLSWSTIIHNYGILDIIS